VSQAPTLLPPTPGEVLREDFFSVKGEGRITQDQLARAMKVSRFSINQLLNGRRNLTAEMALRLARATGTTAEYWLKLQMNSDLAVARLKLEAELDAITPVRRPVPAGKLFYDIHED
jgi:antitoxin HigA-1